jgi:hypothetical protein
MNRPKELIRNYRYADRNMLELGQSFSDLLAEHLASFTPKYPYIDALFQTEFQGRITAAKLFNPDTIVVDDIHLQTTIVETAMTNGRNLVSRVFHYVKLAFPNNEAILNVFGHSEYESYCRSHTKFPIILTQAHKKANDPLYKAALLLKGLTVADITMLETICTTIEAENKKQFNEEKERVITTQTRIGMCNSIWGTMAELSECAKDIFSDNWALYHAFLLYPNEPGGPTPPEPPVPPVE